MFILFYCWHVIHRLLSEGLTAPELHFVTSLPPFGFSMNFTEILRQKAKQELSFILPSLLIHDIISFFSYIVSEEE